MRARVVLPAVAAAVVGLVVGLGTYTFLYGQAYAYLLDDPQACVNCHVMRDYYDLWLVASHRTVSCNTCHVPKPLVPKYLAKLDSGWRHAYVFTWGDPQVLRAKGATREILQANCISCHGDMLAAVQPPGVPRTQYCSECHRGVAHGAETPVAGPAHPPPPR